ncbi:hypothetical protein [Nocardioides speluncae]|uniref:hypothetical protein n=1 Tax=Nocardioides speluncae TaxID=2670337 RepID=UPI0012B16889|nr:hypothetical protein [Nocardioides speluncae]
MRRPWYAALAGALLTSIIAGVPGQVAAADLRGPADYHPLTTFTADTPGDVTPGTSDLAGFTLRLDPNYGQVDVDGSLGADPGRWVRRVIATLGNLDNEGTCQAAVEVVSSTMAGSTDDVNIALAVRLPGETTLPPEREFSLGRFTGWREQAALLENLVPDCGSVRMVNATGATLDSGVATLVQRPAEETGVEVSPRGVPARQFLLGTPTRFRIRVERTLPNPVYDGLITVTAPADLEVRHGRSPNWEGRIYDHYFTLISTGETKPGWKRVTVRATSGNADPATYEFWTYAIGPPPERTGSLSGRRYAARFDHEGAQHPAAREVAARGPGPAYSQRETLWFLSDRLVFLGVPTRGKPTCTPDKVVPDSYTGCQHYWWNKESNLLQIGRWVGRVTATGIVYHHPVHNVPVRFEHRFGTARAGTRYRGTWTDQIYRGNEEWILTVRLTLRRDGTFTLAQSESGLISRMRGRYRINQDGRLTLRLRDGKTVTRTIVIGKNRRGRLDPGNAGIFINLPQKATGAWLRKVQ